MYRGERQIQRYTRLLSTRTRHKYAIASAKLFPILLFSRETANQRTVQSVAQVIGSVACSHEVRLVSARVRRSWNRSVSPSRFLSRWQQSPFQRIPSGCVANARSDIVSSGLGANLENNGWKDRWISMIQIPLPYINRCIVLGGTWCRKSLRAPDVIGIYWAENWDALSPLELRLPSFLPSFDQSSVSPLSPSSTLRHPLFLFPTPFLGFYPYTDVSIRGNRPYFSTDRLILAQTNKAWNTRKIYSKRQR